MPRFGNFGGGDVKTNFFAYGTLKTDGPLFNCSELRHTLLTKRVARAYGFKMYDLGDFPGAVHTGDAEDWIEGEWQSHHGNPIESGYTVLDIVDHMEKHIPDNLRYSLYDRMKTRTRKRLNNRWVITPQREEAWIYTWLHGCSGRSLRKWRNDNG